MSIVSCKPTITRKDLEGVLDCLISDSLTGGETVKNFESRVADLTGVKYSIAVNSLVSAYHLSFRALGITAGDEVIMPSYFDTAPLGALSMTGASPVFADTEDGSLAPSTEQYRSRLTGKTKAIIIGHTMGFNINIEPMKELNVPIIEDISHSIGSEFNEKPMSHFSALTVCSFAPSMMITTGNGGMVLTANSRFYSIMKELRAGSETAVEAPYDYVMTDFQGAMGIAQLANLSNFIRRRRDIAKIYFEALKHTTHRTLYAFSESFAYQSFPILFDSPVDKVYKYWKKCGIEVERPVGKPLHSYLNFKAMDYPNSERLSKKLFSIPIYPTLTKKEIEKISRSLANFA
jgi:perosamine synthetase